VAEVREDRVDFVLLDCVAELFFVGDDRGNRRVRRLLDEGRECGTAFAFLRKDDK
jgi:hypothetical protein